MSNASFNINVFLTNLSANGFSKNPSACHFIDTVNKWVKPDVVLNPGQIQSACEYIESIAEEYRPAPDSKLELTRYALQFATALNCSCRG